MGVEFHGFERVSGKLEHFFDGLDDDLKLVGETAAEGIVQLTLAGVGENDQPFQPYSPAYQKLIDAVGGKPQGVPNLRGIFSKDNGASNPRFRSAERRRLSGADRRAYINVTAGGKTFTARTPVTRVARGLTDPESEMSLDRISITSSGGKLTLTYNPRQEAYMLTHQNGDGKMPKRTWFTLKRRGIQERMDVTFKALMAARVQRFNSVGGS